MITVTISLLISKAWFINFYDWIINILFGSLFVIDFLLLLCYFCLELFLSIASFDFLWPLCNQDNFILGDILLSGTSFLAALLVQFGFSKEICKLTNHYFDGTFFGSLFLLCSVMMIYKFWESITTEDSEYCPEVIQSWYKK